MQSMWKMCATSNLQNCGIWTDFFFYRSKWTWPALSKFPCYFPQSWCYCRGSDCKCEGHFWVKTKKNNWWLPFSIAAIECISCWGSECFHEYFEKFKSDIFRYTFIKHDIASNSIDVAGSSTKIATLIYELNKVAMNIDCNSHRISGNFVHFVIQICISKTEIAMIQELCSRQMETKTEIWMKRHSTLGMLILIVFKFIANAMRCSCAIFNECWRIRSVHWISIRRCDASSAPANDN